MRDNKKTKITRNKPSNYPNYLPKIYCKDEMRKVIDFLAMGDETDLSKELRAVIEASPIYQKAKDNYSQYKQQQNETVRTTAI